MRGRREHRGVHVAVFHPPRDEAAARATETRLDLAAAVADIVGMLDPGGLVIFPAGFLRAPSEEVMGELAERMLELSGAATMSIAFGIDVAEPHGWAPLDGAPDSFAFACDAGRPVLWPASCAGPSDDATGERCITLSGMRAGVVVGSEVFNASLRREVARGRPDVIALLTHVGPSARWAGALGELSAVGPVVMAGESLTGQVPTWLSAPAGWCRSSIGSSPHLTIERYQPTSAQAAIDQAR